MYRRRSKLAVILTIILAYFVSNMAYAVMPDSLLSDSTSSRATAIDMAVYSAKTNPSEEHCSDTGHNTDGHSCATCMNCAVASSCAAPSSVFGFVAALSLPPPDRRYNRSDNQTADDAFVPIDPRPPRRH